MQIFSSIEMAQRILDLSPSIIYIYDILNYKVRYTNFKGIELLGYAISDYDLMGDQLFNTIVHPDDLATIEANLHKMSFFKEGEQSRIEYRLKSKSGNWLWFQDDIVAYKFGPKGLEQILGYATNIDASKNNHAALETALLNLKHSQAHVLNSTKMAALGEMSAGIAHEINNPLTVIQSRAFQIQQLSELKLLTHEKVLQISESISKTADKIARIIKSLRSFSRDASADPLDLLSARMIVEETLEFCNTRFNANSISINIENLPADLEVECRIVQLEQVLLNLFNNSFDATKDLQERWLKIEGQGFSDRIELYITDSGKGIAPEIVDKIMLPFFTTKEVNKGTGLGLSISQGIIQAHGGDLFYDSNSPNTRFIIRLPRTQ